MEATQAFLDQVDDLTDLELAVLLSLIAQHHCIVETSDHLLDDLASELALVQSLGPSWCEMTDRRFQIVRDIFRLSYIVLDRDHLQSVDGFVAAILDDNSDEFDQGPQNSDAEHDNVRAIHFPLSPSVGELE